MADKVIWQNLLADYQTVWRWNQQNWWEKMITNKLWGWRIFRRAQLFGLIRSLLLFYHIFTKSSTSVRSQHPSPFPLLNLIVCINITKHNPKQLIIRCYVICESFQARFSL